jgi:hypothetical protein
MTIYFTGAFLVFSILLNAFIKDDSTPKTHVDSWICIIVATAIWPIVLPSMVRKKLSKVTVETIPLTTNNWNLDQKIN